MRSRPRPTHRRLLSEHLFGHDIHEPFLLFMIAPLLLQNCFHFPLATALQFRPPAQAEAAPAALRACVSVSARCIRLHQSSASPGSALGELKKMNTTRRASHGYRQHCPLLTGVVEWRSDAPGCLQKSWRQRVRGNWQDGTRCGQLDRQGHTGVDLDVEGYRRESGTGISSFQGVTSGDIFPLSGLQYLSVK